MELGGKVEPRAVWGAVEVDGDVAGGRSGAHHFGEALGEALLAELALGVPGSGGDVAAAGDEDRTHLAQLTFGALDAGRRFQDRVNGEWIVVSGRDQDAHVGLETLVCKPAPGFDLLGDRRAERLVQVFAVSAHALDVGVVRYHRVKAKPVDLSPKPILLVTGHHHRLAAHLCRQGAVLSLDGHQSLAGYVTTEDERVGLVCVRSRDEFPKAALGAMDVGREKYAEGPLSGTASEHLPSGDYSGGSSRIASRRSIDDRRSRICLAIR